MDPSNDATIAAKRLYEFQTERRHRHPPCPDTSARGVPGSTRSEKGDGRGPPSVLFAGQSGPQGGGHARRDPDRHRGGPRRPRHLVVPPVLQPVRLLNPRGFMQGMHVLLSVIILRIFIVVLSAVRCSRALLTPFYFLLLESTRSLLIVPLNAFGIILEVWEGKEGFSFASLSEADLLKVFVFLLMCQESCMHLFDFLVAPGTCWTWCISRSLGSGVQGSYHMMAHRNRIG